MDPQGLSRELMEQAVRLEALPSDQVLDLQSVLVDEQRIGSSFSPFAQEVTSGEAWYLAGLLEVFETAGTQGGGDRERIERVVRLTKTYIAAAASRRIGAFLSPWCTERMPGDDAAACTYVLLSTEVHKLADQHMLVLPYRSGVPTGKL
jgi:hypothetical protein